MSFTNIMVARPVRAWIETIVLEFGKDYADVARPVRAWIETKHN